MPNERANEDDRWPASWLRGVLEVAVLAVLADGESYGYALAQRLSAAGMGRVSGNTLYPVLARLESDHAVSSRWAEGAGGPGRKFYALTDTGQKRLDADGERWGRFAACTTALVDGSRRTGRKDRRGGGR